MLVRITDKTRKHQALNSWLKKTAMRILEELSNSKAPAAKYLSQTDLSILLVSKKEMQKINKNWREKDVVTDVLSFPQYEKRDLIHLKPEKYLLLGDIVICLDQAREQAKEKGLLLRVELKWLLIHGILHLLGYDHEISTKEAIRMRRIEKRLLTR